MPRQSISQGTCNNCDESEENFMVLDSDMSVDDETVSYDLRCSCGSHASLQLDETGIAEAEGLHHADASWNQSDDSEDSDE